MPAKESNICRLCSQGYNSDWVLNKIDTRRTNNCEIMLTKIKMPLPDMLDFMFCIDVPTSAQHVHGSTMSVTVPDMVVVAQVARNKQIMGGGLIHMKEQSSDRSRGKVELPQLMTAVSRGMMAFLNWRLRLHLQKKTSIMEKKTDAERATAAATTGSFFSYFLLVVYRLLDGIM